MANHLDRHDVFVVRVTGPAGDWQEWELPLGPAGLTLDRLVYLAGPPVRVSVLGQVQTNGLPALHEESLDIEDTQEWPRPLLGEDLP